MSVSERVLYYLVKQIQSKTFQFIAATRESIGDTHQEIMLAIIVGCSPTVLVCPVISDKNLNGQGSFVRVNRSISHRYIYIVCRWSERIEEMAVVVSIYRESPHSVRPIYRNEPTFDSDCVHICRRFEVDPVQFRKPDQIKQSIS